MVIFEVEGVGSVANCVDSGLAGISQVVICGGCGGGDKPCGAWADWGLTGGNPCDDDGRGSVKELNLLIKGDCGGSYGIPLEAGTCLWSGELRCRWENGSMCIPLMETSFSHWNTSLLSQDENPIIGRIFAGNLNIWFSRCLPNRDIISSLNPPNSHDPNGGTYVWIGGLLKEKKTIFWSITKLGRSVRRMIREGLLALSRTSYKELTRCGIHPSLGVHHLFLKRDKFHSESASFTLAITCLLHISPSS